MISSSFTARRPVVLLFFICLSATLSSQCALLQDIPLPERLMDADLVVEAEVISERCFWDKGLTSIYTAYTLRPLVSFRGQVVEDIELIKRGGFIGSTGMIESPTIEVAVGDIGIFMLAPSSVMENGRTTSGLNRYRGAGGPLSVVTEDRSTKQYSDRLAVHGSRSAIHSIISSTLDTTPMVIESREGTAEQPAAVLMPIISFSPLSITAGTLSELTIDGSGFGSTPGVVLFRNANSGGQNFTVTQPFDIVSWSDTQVIVHVPSAAGTGDFVVQTAAGANSFSTAELQIAYAQSTVVSGFTGTFKNYRTRHADVDGNGGYVWQMYTDFAAIADASDSFSRALETWSCTSGINWEIGPTTLADSIALDGVNVVRFDNGSELTGAIGVCTSYYSGCGDGSGDLDWYVSELDIVFNTETNWNFGPEPTTGSSIDFESVALHELGHGHQLGHVIDLSNDVMHFVILNSTDLREPSANNVNASNEVSTRSVSEPVCSLPAMDPIECGSVCPGDLNGNSLVNVDDFLLFSSTFGMSCTCPADLNSNGSVNIDDFLIFSSAFGNSCE